MNLAWLSVSALAAAIGVSCFTRLNAGLVSLAFAWIIGVYFGGMTVRQVAAGFPSELFLTMAGVTLLFTQAQVNGTLDRIAHRAVALCRGNRGVMPVMFFVLSAGLASAGPGNIATAALIAPMAMAVAARMGIPAFLMAIMVGNGANSGSLSPLAPTGVIVNGLMGKIGLEGRELSTWWTNLAAHAAVAFAGYLLLGGGKLLLRGGRAEETGVKAEPLETRHWITLAVIAALMAGVLALKVNVGMAAFAGAVILVLLRAADDAEAVRQMPWGTILMVCGVTVLISILEKTAGIDLLSGLMARLATPASAVPVVAAVTGLISAYSSTSGVVLPAFLPTVPGLVARMGGGDPLSIASAMNVGGHLVDVSPLSTIGALCLAGVPAGAESRALFHKLLAWGLSMTILGAGVCYLLFG